MNKEKMIKIGKVVYCVLIAVFLYFSRWVIYGSLGAAFVTPALFLAGGSFIVFYRRIKIFWKIAIIAVMFIIFIVFHIEIYPEITGTIKDSITGKGVENAIMVSIYRKNLETLGGIVGQDKGKNYAVSDKQGFYFIPRKIVFILTGNI